MNKTLLSLALVIAISALLVIGNKTHGQLKNQRPVVEFVDKYEAQYRTQQPMIGTVIESIPAVDEQGKPFDMKQLEGKFSVFVFGCLT